MRMLMIIAAALLTIGASESRAQVPLSSYADANGYLDVHKITCAQLANTSEQDVNMLTAWFGGWYNGLGHKHFIHFDRGELLEHEVIVYCREHPERRVLDALAVVFRDEQVAAGAEMRPMRAASTPQAAPLHCTIHVSVVSGGFIVGVGGGEGVLNCDGQVYPITIGGVGVGVIGFAGGEVDGVVYNLRSPADIVGTYGAAGAGLTIIGGAKVVQLQNERGVIIQAHGVQIGLEVNLNLAGLTIAMN
jgi:HdeA/HdeB family